MRLSKLHIATLVLVTLGLFGCENKDYKKCLADAEKYQKDKVECLAKTDATEKEACLSKVEVHKMTKEDCDSSYK